MLSLHHQVWIAARPERVYAAISSADRLSEWWDDHAERWQGAALLWEHHFSRGGALCMQVDERTQNQRVVLTCVDAPRDGTVDQEWLGTELRFELTARAERPHTNRGWMADMRGQTILDFTHSGWSADAEYAGLCNATWGMVLMRLKQQCEAG